ncbi:MULTISPECIES: hypothetical protein [Enterobacter]|uniref:hypothetical protein n=1 Tax=Enterobacter TaxID=547 RepID=UPI001CBEBEC9|nr:MULTISPECIES: hypothetical protein [Enterobacter]UAN18754.1 hypothetical protein KGP20_25155 [Enterobacter asburiae]UAN20351.1 hypothetical protein KGP25_14195 [Enterobacter sp. JBIWA003]UAN24666.1 hypothetical protein KGP25_25135 [Enterobacter sp. JBIWA003]UAN24670.1 hypothetical protein KGP25_25180 [Enterobacter sp. JBIWA003]
MLSNLLKSFVLFIYCFVFFMVMGFLFRAAVALLSYYNNGYFNFPLSEVQRGVVFSLIASCAVWLYALLSKIIDWYNARKKTSDEPDR